LPFPLILPIKFYGCKDVVERSFMRKGIFGAAAKALILLPVVDKISRDNKRGERIFFDDTVCGFPESSFSVG
jgi:hypothetical protein